MAFCFKSVDFLFICCCQGPSFAPIYGCWKYACSNDFQLCLLILSFPDFFSIFLSCPAAMAILFLISFEHFPFPSILDPRYSKFSKHSTVSPSTVMSDVFLHLSVSTILVFCILRKRPLFSLCSLTECIS